MVQQTPERRAPEPFPAEGVAGGGDGHHGGGDGHHGGQPVGLLDGQAAGLFRPWDTPESLSPTSGQSISPSSSSDRTSPTSSANPSSPPNNISPTSSTNSSPPSDQLPQAVYSSEGTVLYTIGPIKIENTTGGNANNPLPPFLPPGSRRRKRLNTGTAASPNLAKKTKTRWWQASNFFFFNFQHLQA